MREGTTLGTLKVLGHDQPWFECRFEPTEAFEAVRPLFAEEVALVESGDLSQHLTAWEDAWARIEALNLVLEPLGDGPALLKFVLHVYDDGTARLRY